MVDPIRDIANTFADRQLDLHSGFVNLALASDSQQEQDYYEILGVKKDATKQEIHRAFRQLAKKYHPDKNKDKSASDEFIKVFKAYETLSNEKKRKEYDDYTRMHKGAWTTTAPNAAYDFDINDFFKQYEDQFLKHAQQHQYAHHNAHNGHQHNDNHHNIHSHSHFKFHGINLDELFHDIDEDEFSSFGRWFDGSSHSYHDHHQHASAFDGHFGDGASFFGSHLDLDLAETMNQQQHVHHRHSGFHQAGYSCQTTTRQVNGMVMTQTSCS